MDKFISLCYTNMLSVSLRQRKGMPMNTLCEKYLENVVKVHSLAKPKLTDGMTQNEILDVIHDNAMETHALRVENDALLDRLVYSRVPEQLMPQDVEDLKEFADKLFSYNRSLDTGAAYRVHQLLYAYAKYHDDTNLIIRELYYQGLALHYMNLKIEMPPVNLYCEQIMDCFSKGAAYMAQYEEIEDEETRGFIIRCMGNRKLGLTEQYNGNAKANPHASASGFRKYEQIFEETMAVISNPKYRAMNPGLPWGQYEYSMHMDRTTFLTYLRQNDDPEIAAAVMESADYVYQHQMRIAREKDKLIGERMLYMYAAARYHAGRITIEQLVKELYELCLRARPDDFSASGITLNINIPLYLHYYYQLLPEKEKEEIEPRVIEILDRVLTYLFSLPLNEYSAMISSSVRMLLRLRLERNRSFHSNMLDYVLACHAPTYIHSLMVAHLTTMLIGRMIDTRPELLAGILGTENAEDVIRRREEICQHAYRCGLYHDLGKCQILHEIGLYNRRLLDEEYRIIQYHPLMGSLLLDFVPGMEDASIVAQHHHRFYNEEGGYLPSCPECHTPIKHFVDVVTVCDAIDAATDNVGRSYANAKTLTQLLAELRAGAGVRYSPDVVNIFDDEGFCRQVEMFIHHQRRAIYCQIYRGVQDAVDSAM